jgi:hypothetical protein
MRRQRSKTSGGGTSDNISSYNCAIIIYGNMSRTRHSNGSGLPDHKSEVTRRGQLGKVEEGIEILERYKISETDHYVENLGILKWFVDGSHNVHWDCKGHGGAMFTMGKGAVSSYTRKKLNTRSLTKTELVVADVYMPEMLWIAPEQYQHSTADDKW